MKLWNYFWILALLAVMLWANLDQADAAPLVRVAIVDTGLDLKDPRFAHVLCKSGHKDFTGDGIKDYHGHGTHIAGLVRMYAGSAGYCLMIVKYYAEGVPGAINATREIEAMTWAVSHGADIVNVSGGGPKSSAVEALLIHDHPGVTFVVAAGNESQDIALSPYYPASYGYGNMVVVGNAKEEPASSDVRSETSNFGEGVNAWEVGVDALSTLPKGTGKISGTSQACAIRTGKIVKQLSSSH